MIKILKNNKYFILSLIIILIIFNIRLPFYIEAPGGLLNINDRYKINNSPKIKGSINMTYVTEYKANLATIIYANLNKDWDVYKKYSIININETEKEADLRGEIMLKEANNNAIIVAYNKAGKTCNIIDQKMIITYIEEDSDTNLKIGDEIISVDDIKTNSREETINIIKTHNIGEKINFTVKNKKGKILNKYGKLKKNKTVGILISYDKTITTNPELEIEYKSDEYGPSGGLMTTLAIYNKLVKEDITHGYTISGTGTIEEDGTVGEISGIKYKLKGAVKNHADVFFAPEGNNYKEAIKLKKKNNYDITIVKVKTIDDALKYLEKIKED